MVTERSDALFFSLPYKLIKMSQPLEDCWNQIGVKGDQSCPELAQVIHCHNCSVYAQGGRRLLDRPPPADYYQEWTDFLATQTSDQQDQQTTTLISVVIFRLGEEWFALPTFRCREITSPSSVHTLPHRTNAVLLGITNIRGEILLCISLKQFLGIRDGDTQTNLKPSPLEAAPGTSPITYERMMVIANGSETWAFVIDDCYGVYRCHRNEIQPPPASISHSTAAYTKGMIAWNDLQVNYLDDWLLFQALNQKLL